MSIDAVIADSVYEPEGVVRLVLAPRKGEGPGQSHLFVINPPEKVGTFMKAVQGQEIWGSSSCIMVGDKKWAERIGYTSIRLLTPGSESPNTSRSEQSN